MRSTKQDSNMIACPAGIIQYNLTFPECGCEVVMYCELTEKGQNNRGQDGRGRGKRGVERNKPGN